MKCKGLSGIREIEGDVKGKERGCKKGEIEKRRKSKWCEMRQERKESIEERNKR